MALAAQHMRDLAFVAPLEVLVGLTSLEESSNTPKEMAQTQAIV